MKFYLQFILLVSFLSGICVGAGPIYCFSPGKGVKVENSLEGCECSSACVQVEETLAFAKSKNQLKWTPSFGQVNPQIEVMPHAASLS